MAVQLQDYANYLLGSQIGIPIPGWPYNLILDRLKNPFGDLMAAPEFGAYAVRRFCAWYDPSCAVSLTLINLALAQRLPVLVDGLTAELAIAMSDPDTRAQILEAFFDSQTEPGKPFVDAADLCLNLLGSRQYPVLSQRARELGDYLVAHHGNVVSRSKLAEGWPLVAEHGRNSGSLVRLNGLSLSRPARRTSGRAGEGPTALR